MSPFMTMNVSSSPGTLRSAPAVPCGSSSQCQSSSTSGGTIPSCEKYSWMSSPRWLTQRSIRRTPDCARRPMMCSRMGRSPTGTSGLGMIVVYGRSRVPSPPARMTALISLRDVAVPGVEGVGQRARVECGDDLGDAVGDGHVGLEAEDLADLVEGHLVVARVLAAAHEDDLAAAGQSLADQLDEVELAVVLAGAPGVEHLAVDAVARRVEDRAHGAARIADMDVRAPELLAEDLELVPGPQLERELVDGQVEAHARREAVDGGEAHAGGRHPVRTRQQRQLHRHLLLGVERDRGEHAVLGDREG